MSDDYDTLKQKMDRIDRNNYEEGPFQINEYYLQAFGKIFIVIQDIETDKHTTEETSKLLKILQNLTRDISNKNHIFDIYANEQLSEELEMLKNIFGQPNTQTFLHLTSKLIQAGCKKPRIKRKYLPTSYDELLLFMKSVRRMDNEGCYSSARAFIIRGKQLISKLSLKDIYEDFKITPLLKNIQKLHPNSGKNVLLDFTNFFHPIIEYFFDKFIEEFGKLRNESTLDDIQKAFQPMLSLIAIIMNAFIVADVLQSKAVYTIIHANNDQYHNLCNYFEQMSGVKFIRTTITVMKSLNGKYIKYSHITDEYNTLESITKIGEILYPDSIIFDRNIAREIQNNKDSYKHLKDRH